MLKEKQNFAISDNVEDVLNELQIYSQHIQVTIDLAKKLNRAFPRHSNSPIIADINTTGLLRMLEIAKHAESLNEVV